MDGGIVKLSSRILEKSCMRKGALPLDDCSLMNAFITFPMDALVYWMDANTSTKRFDNDVCQF